MHFRSLAVAAVALVGLAAALEKQPSTDAAYVSDDVLVKGDAPAAGDDAHSQNTKDMIEEMQKLFANIPQHDGAEGHEHDEAGHADFEDIMKRLDEILKNHNGDFGELLKGLGGDEAFNEDHWNDAAWDGDMHGHMGFDEFAPHDL